MAVTDSSAASVKSRTGLSARKLKASENSPDWLSMDPNAKPTREGVSLMAQTYVEGRYLEVQTYDYEAPAWRQWVITITDRRTGAAVVERGEFQRDTTTLALKQIGALDPAAS